MDNKEHAYTLLSKTIHSYYPLSLSTWDAFKEITEVISISKDDYLCHFNETPKAFYFLVHGLLTASTLDMKGNIYIKNFFEEGFFVASKAAMLTKSPSHFEIQAIEDSILIQIDFNAYRDLLLEHHDLALFQVHYLEKSWVLGGESKEIALIQENAQKRYETFLESHSNLEGRITQYQIASHLGITPTQLSRIRKNMNHKKD